MTMDLPSPESCESFNSRKNPGSDKFATIVKPFTITSYIKHEQSSYFLDGVTWFFRHAQQPTFLVFLCLLFPDFGHFRIVREFVFQESVKQYRHFSRRSLVCGFRAFFRRDAAVVFAQRSLTVESHGSGAVSECLRRSVLRLSTFVSDKLASGLFVSRRQIQPTREVSGRRPLAHVRTGHADYVGKHFVVEALDRRQVDSAYVLEPPLRVDRILGDVSNYHEVLFPYTPVL